jgi:hypothetical protein
MNVSAFGYASRVLTTPFAPGRRAESWTVELDPVPMGEMHFEITRSSGEPMETPVYARITRDADRSVLTLVPGDEPGHYTCRAPAGGWRVDVYPESSFGIRTLAWSDHLTVPAEGRVTARVQFLPFGSIAVDRGGDRSFSLEIRVDGFRIITAITERHTVLPVVREGVWPYVARGLVNGETKELQRGTVDVRDGKRTVLRIE